jgi:hypothetical protein
MKKQILSLFFYLLILCQMQADLLLLNYGLGGLLIILLALFVYPKKNFLLKTCVALSALTVNLFITNQAALFLNLCLILIFFLLCQILKKNLIFKHVIFYSLLISMILLNYYLTNLIVFKLPTTIFAILPNIGLNVAYSLVILPIFKLLLVED